MLEYRSFKPNVRVSIPGDTTADMTKLAGDGVYELSLSISEMTGVSSTAWMLGPDGILITGDRLKGKCGSKAKGL
jgi:hypothetical protein